MGPKRVKRWATFVLGVWLWSTAFVPPPEVGLSDTFFCFQDCHETKVDQSEKRPMQARPLRRIPSCGAGLWMASSMVAPSHAEGFDPSQWVELVSSNRDFLVASAAAVFTWRQVEEAQRQTEEARRQADEAFKQSDEYKIQQAVQKFMEPFKPDQVIQRDVMETTQNRLRTWARHATIVSGHYLTGKTVAMEEVLRDVPGVWSLTVEDENWKENKLYQSLRIADDGMLKEVLRRVQAKLAELPNPKTKFPIILLEVPRRAKGGGDQTDFLRVISISSPGMDLISTTAKELSSDSQFAHAPWQLETIWDKF